MRRGLALGFLVLAACSFRVIPASGGQDSSSMDARSDAAVACLDGPCSAAGGACIGSSCVIVNITQASVTCPTGMPCRVLCNMPSACKDGVDCGRATTCDVECTGSSTCQDGGVDCGMAEICTVRCDGASSCQNGVGPNRSVECRASACTVTCKGANNACQEGIGDDPGGACTTHCCDGACEGGAAVAATCTNDADCM